MRLFRHLFARSAQAWFPEDGMARITAATGPKVSSSKAGMPRSTIESRVGG